MITCEEFVRRLARLTKDGETDDEDEPFEMSFDDAVDTLHALIDDARAIVAALPPPTQGDEPCPTIP